MQCARIKQVRLCVWENTLMKLRLELRPWEVERAQSERKRRPRALAAPRPPHPPCPLPGSISGQVPAEAPGDFQGRPSVSEVRRDHPEPSPRERRISVSTR